VDGYPARRSVGKGANPGLFARFSARNWSPSETWRVLLSGGKKSPSGDYHEKGRMRLGEVAGDQSATSTQPIEGFGGGYGSGDQLAGWGTSQARQT